MEFNGEGTLPASFILAVFEIYIYIYRYGRDRSDYEERTGEERLFEIGKVFGWEFKMAENGGKADESRSRSTSSVGISQLNPLVSFDSRREARLSQKLVDSFACSRRG